MIHRKVFVQPSWQAVERLQKKKGRKDWEIKWEKWEILWACLEWEKLCQVGVGRIKAGLMVAAAAPGAHHTSCPFASNKLWCIEGKSRKRPPKMFFLPFFKINFFWIYKRVLTLTVLYLVGQYDTLYDKTGASPSLWPLSDNAPLFHFLALKVMIRDFQSDTHFFIFLSAQATVTKQQPIRVVTAITMQLEAAHSPSSSCNNYHMTKLTNVPRRPCLKKNSGTLIFLVSLSWPTGQYPHGSGPGDDCLPPTTGRSSLHYDGPQVFCTNYLKSDSPMLQCHSSQPGFLLQYQSNWALVLFFINSSVKAQPPNIFS